MEKGIFYICPTPIGNLEDITLRTLRILKEVDLIAAEDTRHTVKLLNHYEIKNSLISYHDHNKREKGKFLIKKLKAGVNIALVTDAGMPGISDPGEEIIRLAIKEEVRIVALPGPTAAITGLIVSGLSTDKFVFEGFLPSKRNQRLEELERLKGEYRTIILYESPYRVLALLSDIRKVLGNRKISVSRELTKIYEETFRGNIEEALAKFKKDRPRGEFILIVKGGQLEEVDPYEKITIKKHLQLYMDEGYTKKDAVKKVAELRDLPRNLVYKESLEI